MKAFSKLFLVLALALCLICAMVACGDKDGETADSSDTATAATSSVESVETTVDDGGEAETTAPAAPNLQDGGALTEAGWSGVGDLAQ